ncbi:JmjC domain-containing histone demethylation protein 1 [Ophidiomyces ophidiicola]|uniref:JmjC domain-containing histone demethylation protein 1 n=1 Tax=Ophidiomyces ophidiicola TaxID=1387563 RepID=A0ACB8V2Q9_9EURO|nr:JmjC domain-containing histone demethylation protein 1 [Ophidiomyces ophidiicola]KAI1921041.1 JmjC domain-containing histone demethylation protein 1 [Ophidiomyces ophidiicola]KAI1944493.1 JmjC domain-containing histone demethylation protein 1 [Ophidiomyces ophidiicola]KAI1954507.1 JmjC domain-containing histone demethylation protein 1 [Ophidiomyces ophidiicola]KAI1961805.1 JmjC domain-containing histone demethylation protein 1 [Ophidiomyces ophidiicola]KAI1974493.1 JmjC domain-containing hi
MATSFSFRRHSHSRPPQYRTPSPPRHAVEPISPLVSTSSRSTWRANFHDSAQTKNPFQHHYTYESDGVDQLRENGAPPEPISESKAIGRMGHSRSGSNIDTLATIALATRARLPQFPYNSAANDTCAIAHSPAEGDSMERPSKRAKSERSPTPTWQRSAARPSTSHTSSYDSMKIDAELLLNLARPTNFTPRPSLQLGRHFSDAVPQSHTESKRGSVSHNIANDSVHPANKVSSVFFGCPELARVRSRSDGAAAISRPIINGYGTSSSKELQCTGLAREDNQSGSENLSNLNAPPNVEDRTAQLQAKQSSKPKGRRRSSQVAVKCEGSENATSNQTSCAACNLVRVPMSSGDDGEVTWVNCDGCNRWFHIVCAGFKNDREIRTVDKFICKECRPIHGPTTFVRKSSRPKTSIDYAGLNQGFVKPSAEAPDHHYILPIKEGKMKFLPDNFARLPPRLVTAEYFENGMGMTEPVVIPSYLNPHTPTTALGFQQSTMPEASCQEEFDAIIDSFSNDNNMEEVTDCCQDLLDMVIPDNLTVRAVGELYGLEERLEVIDVKSQQGEDKRWNMQKWVDYYYDNSSSKTVRNVISLEVSQSPIGKLIRRPKIVRDIDLQDDVWPNELKDIGDYPKVQFYCLMSVADCYTDFHIDFGGSSVYYHIIKGKKTFFFIPPKEKHLKKYEEWCNSAAQDTTFLGDQTKECYRVDLSEGDTMLIPSGWIHAVWTPEDSLVIGGNFLTRMNYAMQIKVSQIEKDTNVPRKFRYPFFQKIMWYTALRYIDQDPIPPDVLDSFIKDENYRFYRKFPIYYNFEGQMSKAEAGSSYYNSRFYSQAELDGLPELAKYLLRTALIAGGYAVEGVTKESTKNAVARSIPKGQNDPIETIVKFGIWVAWKRGNEPAAQWTRPGAISLDTKVDISDKKRNIKPTRRSERNVNNGSQLFSTVSESSRPRHAQSSEGQLSSEPTTAISNKDSPVPTRKVSFPDIKSEEDLMLKPVLKNASLGPKRVACDPCRKRRIRCRHKVDQFNDTTPGHGIVSFDSNGSYLQPRRNSDTTSYTAVNTSTDDDAIMHDSHGFGPLDLCPSHQSGVNGNSPGSVTGKKGRNKACEECRKSKRRCIHDESGNVDPIKAQERAKSRTGPIKRPRSTDGCISSSKRPKQSDCTDEWARNFSHELIDAQHEIVHRVPDTDLEQGRVNIDSDTLGLTAQPPGQRSEPMANGDTQGQTINPLGMDSDTSTSGTTAATTTGHVSSAGNLVSPPTSLLDSIEGIANRANAKQALLNEHEHLNKEYLLDVSTPISTSPKTPHPTVPEVTSAGIDIKHGTAASPTTTSNQPTSDSSNSASKLSKPSPRLNSPKRSMSKEAKPTRPLIDRGAGSHRGRHNISPTSPQRHSKPGKRDRTSFAEVDADPESLKLIRELQEQEFGLRKRSTRGRS